MPFPGEVDQNNPLFAQQQMNEAMLDGAQAPVSPGIGLAGPPMPTPAPVMAEGLPDYLGGGVEFIAPGGQIMQPGPPSTDPDAALALGGGSGNGTEPALDLGDKPAFLKGGDDTKDKAAQGKKKKCPSCDAENQADALKCKRCGKALVGKKARDKKNLSQDREHQAVIYNTQGLNLGVEADDGLVWKVACKTGTLALSPGPGQTDVEKPLELTPELFDDMVLSAKEQAFPYITVPETHANGALENTGYVKAWEVLGRDELLADSRLPEKHRGIIEADPEETRYLLSGIEFTEPEVKQKALNGSIPDTSIGVKFNYRNKRTGKLYRAAWEHLALTPMPWVDGLVPFGLSQRGKPVDADEIQTPYDGVYMPLELGIRAQVTTGDGEYSWDLRGIDPPQIRHDALRALSLNTDKIDLPLGVSIGQVDGYWVVNNGYEKMAGIKSNADEALDLAMGCIREQYERERENRTSGDAPVAVGASRELPPWPEGNLGQEPLEGGMDLAISFDPMKHPRDWKGQFRSVLDKLDVEESVKLPGGTEILRVDTPEPMFVMKKDGATSRAVPKAALPNIIEGSNEEPTPDESDVGDEESRLRDSLGDGFDITPEPSPFKAMFKVSRPDTESAPVYVQLNGDDTWSVSGSEGKRFPDLDDARRHIVRQLPATHPAQKRAIATAKEIMPNLQVEPIRGSTIGVRVGGDDSPVTLIVDKDDDVSIVGAYGDRKYGNHKFGSIEEALRDFGKKTGRLGLSQNAPTRKNRGLTRSRRSDSLDGVLHASHHREPRRSESTMPKTVEEVLAEQQAELEASQRRIAELESNLSLSQGVIASQGEQLHRENVNKKVAALNGKVHPAVLLAAKEIYLSDKSAINGEPEEGLALSVQVANGEGGTEERKLQSPTAIVDFMLSAMPAEDGEALRMGQLTADIGELHASAHTEANSEEAKIAAVEAHERATHPERFADDGKGARL